MSVSTKQEVREMLQSYYALFELAYEWQIPVHPTIIKHVKSLEEWSERYGD